MTNKPIESFYAGNIEVAVWENQGEDSKVFHSVTAKRTYMDGNGEWKEAGTVHLLPQQIPDMVLALSKSHEYLRMGMRQRRRQSVATGESQGKESGSETAAREDGGSSADSQPEPAGVENGPAEQGHAGRIAKQRGSSRRTP